MTDYFLVAEDEQYDVAWRRSDEVLSYFLKYEEGSLEGYVPFNFGQVDKWLNLKVKGVDTRIIIQLQYFEMLSMFS